MKVRITLSVLVVALVVVFYGTVAWGVEQKTEAVKVEDKKMLFLCYWELNENMSSMQHIKAAKMLTEAGLFPPPGVEMIRFDKTPSNWGVTVFKADSVEAAVSLISIWRVAVPGFFKKVKMSPAMPVKESAGLGVKLYKSIKEAEAKMAEQKKAASKN
jgi:hypothetical protein